MDLTEAFYLPEFVIHLPSDQCSSTPKPHLGNWLWELTQKVNPGPPILGLSSRALRLSKCPLNTRTHVPLVQKAYQEQVLLILADDDGLIVE